jgi:hypothetical protein
LEQAATGGHRQETKMAKKYVVYHVASAQVKKYFVGGEAALNYAEKLGDAYAACSLVKYNATVDVMVTRVNMMTGKTYQERKSTPLVCSPASESYWSM